VAVWYFLLRTIQTTTYFWPFLGLAALNFKPQRRRAWLASRLRPHPQPIYYILLKRAAQFKQQASIDLIIKNFKSCQKTKQKTNQKSKQTSIIVNNSWVRTLPLTWEVVGSNPACWI